MTPTIRRERDLKSWRQMRPLILAMILVWACIWLAVAHAGEAKLSWVAPTQNTDGTALTNLAGYRIYYGAAANTLTQTVQVASGLSTYTVPNLAPGTWYFAVRAYSSAGVESANSNVVTKTIPQPAPNPPTGLTVIAQTAYRLSLGNADQVRLVAIGIVPYASPCASESVLAHNLVSRKLVKLDPGVTSRPLQVFAKCG